MTADSWLVSKVRLGFPFKSSSGTHLVCLLPEHSAWMLQLFIKVMCAWKWGLGFLANKVESDGCIMLGGLFVSADPLGSLTHGRPLKRSSLLPTSSF